MEIESRSRSTRTPRPNSSYNMKVQEKQLLHFLDTNKFDFKAYIYTLSFKYSPGVGAICNVPQIHFMHHNSMS